MNHMVLRLSITSQVIIDQLSDLCRTVLKNTLSVLRFASTMYNAKHEEMVSPCRQ
jgi:hypothetical protein